MPIVLLLPSQLKKQIAQQAQQKRLEKNLSRKSLAERSGVPESTIKRFETTGNISLNALLELAWVLDSLQDFSQLFLTQSPSSLFQKATARQRGRK